MNFLKAFYVILLNPPTLQVLAENPEIFFRLLDFRLYPRQVEFVINTEKNIMLR